VGRVWKDADMTGGYSESMVALIEEFGRLPGIGKKTAERLAYHVLRSEPTEALRLADAIRRVKENVRRCTRCSNMAEGDLCDICRDAGRDTTTVCVVEQPKDLLALERVGTYRGVYHVLHGHLSPLDGMGPDQLTVEALVQRVRSGDVQEVIMATNPNLEGDGTALYVSNVLAPTGVKVTRLARGLASGGVIEFANVAMLGDAIEGRQNL